MATPVTVNRSWQLPAPENLLSGDVSRIVAGFQGADTDVATLFAEVAGKAASVHGHAQSDISGLVDALAGKAALGHVHALDDLTDVSGAAGAADGYVLVKTSTGWSPASAGSLLTAHQHQQSDIVGLVDALNGKAALLASVTFAGITSNNGNLVAQALSSGNGHLWFRDDLGVNQAVMYWNRADDYFYIRRYATDGTSAEGIIGVGPNIFQFNGHTVWTANTDGAGSGSDSDMVDGYHASAFPRLAITNVFNADQTIRNDAATTGGATNLNVWVPAVASVKARLQLLGSNTLAGQSQQVFLESYQPSGGGAGDAVLDIKVRKDGNAYGSPGTALTLTQDQASFTGKLLGAVFDVRINNGNFFLGTSDLSLSGQPQVNFDLSDTLQYDRPSDEFRFVIGASLKAFLSPNDLISYVPIQARNGGTDAAVQLTTDGGIEIVRPAGGPYIDLKTSTAEDYDVRLQAAAGNVFNIAAAGLTLNGDAVGGNTVLLATATAASSAALDFTAFDDTKYSHYVFELEGVVLDTTAVFGVRLDADGGASFDAGATDYSWSNFAVWSTYDRNYSTGTPQLSLMYGNAPAGEEINGQVVVHNAGAATKETTLVYDMANYNGSSFRHMGAGRRNTAQADNAIRFFPTAGLITSGTIRMYGVKK